MCSSYCVIICSVNQFFRMNYFAKSNEFLKKLQIRRIHKIEIFQIYIYIFMKFCTELNWKSSRYVIPRVTPGCLSEGLVQPCAQWLI